MSNVTYPCYWMHKDASGQWYWIYYAKKRQGDRQKLRELCEPI